MTISTKIMLSILFIGAFYSTIYVKDYETGFELLLIIIVVIQTWYNERINLKK